MKVRSVEVFLTAITGRPAYRQVADDLRGKIADGTYPPGAQLPSTSQLMESYGVSITVVRAAISELRTEGLTIGQPGKGVYVVREPAADAPVDPAELARRFAEMTEVIRKLDDRVSRLEQSQRRGGRRKASD
jgi:DNA-binding GntR family transcriptional regulator